MSAEVTPLKRKGALSLPSSLPPSLSLSVSLSLVGDQTTGSIHPRAEQKTMVAIYLDVYM